MEGLDVTELSISDVLNENDKFRIDSGYFSKDAIRTEQLIDSLPCGFTTLGKVSSCFRKGIFDIKADTYTETGVPFVRISNLRSGLIDDSEIVHISEDVHAAENKTALKFGDLVLSKTAYPAASFVNLPRCNVSQDTIAVRLSSSGQQKINTAYLTAFLNTRYGLVLLDRQFQGNVQMHLSLSDGEKIKIPLFSDALQNKVYECFIGSFQNAKESSALLVAASNTLLGALNLNDWAPPEPLSYTRPASEAFVAGRIDAEHFRPKFDALLEKMKKHGEIVRLGDCVHFCERGRQPQYANEGLPVINSRHVRANNVVIDEDNRFAKEELSQLKLSEADRLTIKQGDILINGTGVGTMGRCAAYLRKERALPDNHVTILRINPMAGLDPVFLSLQLNSIVGQMQVEQYFKGSSGQIELYPSEIKEFRIWVAQPKIQQQIKSLLDNAHLARKEAETLLEQAKRAVEIAIEESEAAAIKYLKEI
ncbi:MAG: hypothetical protein HGB15_03905 [Chlorobaculum sp.]|nr:hypothetical protein [Chlorobaculum sp.]